MTSARPPCSVGSEPSHPKDQNKSPSKIHNDALLEDVAKYQMTTCRRAQRLNCSKSGIEAALKRLGISQKKDFRASKSQSDTKVSLSNQT